jgi:hypothetical protein
MRAQVVLVIEDNMKTRKIGRLTLGNEAWFTIEGRRRCRGTGWAHGGPELCWPVKHFVVLPRRPLSVLVGRDA